MRFYVMTALRIHTAVFWDMKPYIFIYVALSNCTCNILEDHLNNNDNQLARRLTGRAYAL
jgi:hypothetical protein